MIRRQSDSNLRRSTAQPSAAKSIQPESIQSTSDSRGQTHFIKQKLSALWVLKGRVWVEIGRNAAFAETGSDPRPCIGRLRIDERGQLRRQPRTTTPRPP